MFAVLELLRLWVSASLLAKVMPLVLLSPALDRAFLEEARSPENPCLSLSWLRDRPSPFKADMEPDQDR